MREILEQAQNDAIAALKGYFDGQNLSQEDQNVIFDTLEATGPLPSETLNLATQAEQRLYNEKYMRTIRSLKSEILQGQSMDTAVEKYQHEQEIDSKAGRDLQPFLEEHIKNGEPLSSILASLQFPDNTEDERRYATTFTRLVTEQLTRMMEVIAIQAAEADIKNQSTAEYDRNVAKESDSLLKTFKEQYEKIMKEKAEKIAIEDAKKAAKEDYEAGNEENKNKEPMQSMSDAYRNAYINKYSTAYKLAINELKPHGPAADNDDELEQLRQLEEQNEKKRAEMAKVAKVKNPSHKLKVAKAAIKFLNKVAVWRQKQLNDVEDVIEEFGSVQAIHNPYRENYYSKEERERCEKILVAYERLQEFLGISPARHRDGSKPYMSIKDAMAVPGLTKEQKQALQALEGKVTNAYFTLVHSAKDSTELDAIVEEAYGLLDNLLVREDKIAIPAIVGTVTNFLKNGETLGYSKAIYQLPQLKAKYDTLMSQKPLTRANYAAALAVTDQMETLYELERKLAKSFMAHNKSIKPPVMEPEKKQEKAEEKKQASEKVAEKKPKKVGKTNSREVKEEKKVSKTSTPTSDTQLSSNSKQVEPALSQTELLRQLHEAQQEIVQLKEKNNKLKVDYEKVKEKKKKLKEDYDKKSKSLKSAKAEKKRLETQNTQLKQSIELRTKNVDELTRQMQQTTSELNILRDAVANEERQKEQYKQMVDEMVRTMKHQSSVELNPDEKEVEELVSYMDSGRLENRFFESEASREVLNDLHALKEKGTLRPEYAEKLNKAIRQIEEGRNNALGQPEFEIPFQKHL